MGYELSNLQRKLGIDSAAMLKEMEKIGDFSVAVHTDLGQLQYLDQLLIAYDETILKQKKIVRLNLDRSPCYFHSWRMLRKRQNPTLDRKSTYLRKTRINARRYYRYIIVVILSKI